MRSILALTAGGLLVACSGETAIVLEVHKDLGVSSEVKHLRVFAGVGHDAELIDPAWWVAAELDEGEASVALDEEMGASTYRYLARPGGGIAAGTDLMFVVAGYKNETDPKPVVFGHSSAPVRFGDGEVRVYDFPLVTFADSFHGVAATGCVWWDDEGLRLKRDAIAPRDDGDCDAYAEDNDSTIDCMLDCADADPEIHPGQTEICADGVDQNCCNDDDGQDDLDGDGFAVCGTLRPDCVDLAPGTTGPLNVFGVEVPSNEIHPEAVEVCDGIDNDCLGGCDDADGFDLDGDNYLNCRSPDATQVVGVHRSFDGCTATAPDCLELPRTGAPPPASVHPDAIDDSCDGWDQDCDETCDEIAVAAGDQDGDGFPACTTDADWIVPEVPQCRLGVGADCGGDTSQFALPGRAERCDGLDFDCDGLLFPTVSPCFVAISVSEPRCVVGRRSCIDTPGAVNAGFEACMHDANGPQASVPMEWCTQTCSMPTDPVQCLDDDVTCGIGFPSAEAGMPCQPPPADIPLPIDQGDGGCNYVLVGGGSQGDWLVTLVGSAGQTGPIVSGCGSSLRVLGARPDAEDRVVLVMTGVGPHTFELRRQNTCGVLCTAPSP